ncbi:uncharacterized protein LOC127117954 isoform X1 [Lathyrus oleraceus]|uniref:SHSP domain-containing protein n=1 Tax=Pisum sativum TaxID=3888 RepID=A0A9D4YBH1_PEA|nr:uncharacterized protein LOC127117954 isoform X1 [Pisum sativum]KAI5433576.1 hypothetical protein KIW84_020751 [Pisum sativum]
MSLDQKTREADRIYDEFEPAFDCHYDGTIDTMIFIIPGFKKEQLRVQITKPRMLRVSGERQMNEKTWRRVCKEIFIPPYSDASKMSAKFEAGVLYVKLPRLIKQQKIAPAPTQQEPQKPQQQTIPQKPNTDHASDQKKQQEPKKDIEEVTRKNEKDKEEESSRDGENKKIEKRSVTMEMVSRQRQEYVNALCRLVDEVKRQKKLVNVLLLVFLILMFGIYVKNVINSFFSGGHKHQEL